MFWLDMFIAPQKKTTQGSLGGLRASLIRGQGEYSGRENRKDRRSFTPPR